MAVTHDHTRLIVYGGYSKERVKRDVDRGQIHSDMFALTFDSQSICFTKVFMLSGIASQNRVNQYFLDLI